jgi:predicted phage tail protein
MSIPEEGGEEATGVVEEQPEVETEAGASQEGDEAEEKPEGPGEDETVVSLGAKPEVEAEQESSTFRELRKRLREQERAAREAKAELDRLKAPAKPKLGPKPTLADFDYDDEKFAAALEAHVKQKAAVEAAEAEEKRAQEKQAEEWTQTVHRYRERKTELAAKVADFDDAEEAVASTLSVAQQSAIMAYAAQPEALIYALGRNEEKLGELAKQKDILKFVATIAKLEAKELTVTTAKKQPPKPAKVVTGATAPATAVASKTLERLEEEAARTGDRSKIHAYQREQKLKKGK